MQFQRVQASAAGNIHRSQVGNWEVWRLSACQLIFGKVLKHERPRDLRPWQPLWRPQLVQRCQTPRNLRETSENLSWAQWLLLLFRLFQCWFCVSAAWIVVYMMFILCSCFLRPTTAPTTRRPIRQFALGLAPASPVLRIMFQFLYRLYTPRTFKD